MAQPATPHKESAMAAIERMRVGQVLRRFAGSGLRYIVPVACSAAMLWWLFRKVDFHEMLRIMSEDVHWGWIVLMMVITTLSHMVRGYRWGLQLAKAGIHPKLEALFVSIFGNYAFNLVVPRLGEAWRCVFIARRQRAKLSVVVGTLVGDRLSDAVVVVALLCVMVAVAQQAMTEFIQRYAVVRELVKVGENPWLWSIVAVTVFGVWGCFTVFKRFKPIVAADKAMLEIWQGFKVLFTMNHKWLYLWLTLGIWVCYFSETYVCFLAFPFTQGLVTAHYAWGLLPGLVCFVFCSLSMAIPSNGGLGPWNLAMVYGLTLFGVDTTQAAAFAMLMWSAQAVMLFLLGIYTLAYVSATADDFKTKPDGSASAPQT